MELTTLSVVKGLLLQMLQLSVGDNTLYKSLALAYELSVKGSPTSQVESALWKALEEVCTVIEIRPSSLMVLIT